MKKKLLAILMITAMAASMLAGCGSKEGADNSGSQSEAGENKDDAAAGDKEEAAEDSGKEDAGQTEKDGEEEQKAEGSEPAADGETFTVGVIQLAEHPALDASYEGFMEGLKEAGFEEGKNLTVDYQNAQGDQSNCLTIAEKFVNDGVDLILAIATPAAQAAASKTTEIPILVTAVTDPASSGLVESNEAPGGNVSGTSDLTPVSEQITLLHELLPEAKNVGVLYCSAEDNSKFQADLAMEALESLGMTGEEFTFSTLDEIQAVVDSMKGKVDAIYAPTDNKVAEGMATVSMLATEAGLAVIGGESGMVDNGALATFGLSYFNLGKLTANQAAAILKGEAEPATTPIGYLEAADCEFSYNEETASALDITIDASKYE